MIRNDWSCGLLGPVCLVWVDCDSKGLDYEEVGSTYLPRGVNESKTKFTINSCQMTRFACVMPRTVCLILFSKLRIIIVWIPRSINEFSHTHINQPFRNNWVLSHYLASSLLLSISSSINPSSLFYQQNNNKSWVLQLSKKMEDYGILAIKKIYGIPNTSHKYKLSNSWSFFSTFSNNLGKEIIFTFQKALILVTAIRRVVNTSTEFVGSSSLANKSQY